MPRKHVFKLGIESSKVNEIRESLKKLGPLRVFIRQTNKGAINGFHHKYAVGKPLAAKAKSSNSPFATANLAVPAALAKNFDGREETLIDIQKKVSGTLAEKDLGFAKVNKYFFFHYEPTKLSLEQQFGKSVLNVRKYAKLKLSVNGKSGDYHAITCTTEDRHYVNSLRANEYLIPRITKNEGILKVHYLLIKHEKGDKSKRTKDVQEARIFEMFQESVGPFQESHVSLYQVYIAFENEGLWKGDQPESFIELNSGEMKLNFYPLHILAEEWASNNQTSYYEMVADYDLFAVCPTLNKLKKSQWPVYLPQRNLKNYAINGTTLEAADPIYDPPKPGLGFISPLENEIRKLINRVFELPVARHGCETLNLHYTSKREDVDSLIMIDSKDDAKMGVPKKLNWYLSQWNGKNEDFLFVPLNPCWKITTGFFSKKDATKSILSRYLKGSAGSQRAFLCEYYKRQHKFLEYKKYDEMKASINELISCLLPPKT